MTQNNANDAFTMAEDHFWNNWVEGKNRGQSDEKIAEENYRSRSYITRLKQKAKRNGAYQEWANTLLHWTQEKVTELYPKVEAKDPVAAFHELTNLLGRGLTQRIEQNIHQEVVQNGPDVDFRAFTPEQREEIRRVSRLVLAARVDRET